MFVQALICNIAGYWISMSQLWDFDWWLSYKESCFILFFFRLWHCYNRITRVDVIHMNRHLSPTKAKNFRLPSDCETLQRGNTAQIICESKAPLQKFGKCIIVYKYSKSDHLIQEWVISSIIETKIVETVCLHITGPELNIY